MTTHHRLLILGSGPAGYTAAIYAARANLCPALITGIEPGGQLTKTHQIDNWPGEANGINGFDLMDHMLKQAERFDTKIIYDFITAADLSVRPFILHGEADSYTCDALIIATGASAKYLGIPSEQQFIGKGVSACAICDGSFYKGADVAVIGGGNTAIEDALYLAKIANKVTIVHRRDTFRAELALVSHLKQLNNIHIEYNQIVDEILGDEKGVTGIRIQNINSKECKELSVKGIFVAIGHNPNTNLFINQLEMNQDYLVTKCGINGISTATNIPGVFAAGDVADPIYRQAVTAAASGCRAAIDAKRYLNSK